MTHYSKQNPKTIQSLFNSIAINYDRTNSLLSFRMHEFWNRSLVKQIPQELNAPLLDLCAGTGAIAFSYLEKSATRKTAYLLDFSSQMLAYAKLKEKKIGNLAHDIHYLQANAEVIPLPDESVGCITLAYGIRNIQHPTLCLKESYRTLKPGGKLAILELTSPKNPVLKMGHRFYLNSILPIAGKLMTKNKEAYDYLKQSIKQFIEPEELRSLMKVEGFKHVSITPLSAGIATLIVANK